MNPEAPNSGRVLLDVMVGDADQGSRLDAFVAGRLSEQGVSRSKVQAFIKAGQVTVDGLVQEVPKCKLMSGQRVELAASLPEKGLVGVPGDIEAVYRDEHVLIVNKPSGLTVHPAPGENDPTLVHLLVHSYPELAALDPERPGIVHRIDKDTSGLLAVALTEKARLALSKMFAGRQVDKTYLAICFGAPKPAKGRLDDAIGRDPSNRTKMAVAAKGGREAVSEYQTLWTCPDGRFSLLAVKILTGRTHQIRVHLAHAGHPLVGDLVYGPRENKEWAREFEDGAPPATRQMLHAWRLRFRHPVTGEALRFGSRPPVDFMAALSALAHKPLRLGVVGSPGSGKSAVGKILAKRGVPVFSADAVVARLYEAGGDGAELLAGRFGGRFNDGSGAVDKRLLFQTMLDDEAMRREVLDMVHPLVKYRLREFWREHADAVLAAAEIPLLLEVGWNQGELVDLAVCVTAPEDQRHARMDIARTWGLETAAKIESWQWPQEKKVAACDMIVDNSGDLNDLERETEALLEQLAGEIEKRRQARLDFLKRLTNPESG